MAYLFLYCLIGGVIAFALLNWWVKDLYLSDDNIAQLVLTSVFWPIATPFAVGVICALKHRNKR